MITRIVFSFSMGLLYDLLLPWATARFESFNDVKIQKEEVEKWEKSG